MRLLPILICIAVLFALSACSSPPEEVERKSAYEPVVPAEPEAPVAPPDYTKDWRTIADLGPQIYYGPPRRSELIKQLLWKRRNWRMTLTGEWVDDLVEDMQRRYRWDRKLSNWEAEHGNPEWPDPQKEP